MDKKKLKLSISGNTKKTINNIKQHILDCENENNDDDNLDNDGLHKPKK